MVFIFFSLLVSAPANRNPKRAAHTTQFVHSVTSLHLHLHTLHIVTRVIKIDGHRKTAGEKAKRIFFFAQPMEYNQYRR